MSDHFNKVREYLLELDYDIKTENTSDEVFVIENESSGVRNLVIACADPILILEQFMFELKASSEEILRSLLIKNRDIVHGTFALDETGKKVIFRDTLQLENLDFNELEGSINSLSLLLSEYSDKLIEFSKH